MPGPYKKGENPNGKHAGGTGLSKYKPEYCDMLIEHAKKGLSYKSFAAEAGVSWRNLYYWEDIHPEFLQAKEKAKAIHYNLYEKELNRASYEKEANAALIIFRGKAIHGLSDRQEVKMELTGKNGGPIATKDVSSMTPEEVDIEYDRYTK